MKRLGINPISPEKVDQNLDELTESYLGFNDFDGLVYGFGDGYILSELAQKYNNSQITGVEISEEMVKRTKERLEEEEVDSERIRLLKRDGFKYLEESDDSFDLITAYNSIQEYNDPMCLIENFHSSLNEGGVLKITFPQSDIFETTVDEETGLECLTIELSDEVLSEKLPETYDGFLGEDEEYTLEQLYPPEDFDEQLENRFEDFEVIESSDLPAESSTMDEIFSLLETQFNEGYKRNSIDVGYLVLKKRRE